MLSTFRTAVCLAALLIPAGALTAGEKGLMHCFAYTVKNVSDADWQAFHKATDALPGKITGVKRVWYGKLLRPLAQFTVDAEARKKLAGGESSVKADVKRLMRQNGVCMEMDSEATLKTYATHPYHKEWVAAYEKVRVEGTTTYDIVAQ
jgi:hypothetical protein